MPRTCVSAAAPGLPADTLSRRSLLTGAAVAGVAFVGPAAASSGETPILPLFRRYMALIAAAQTHETGKTGAAEDEEMERLFYRPADKLEKAIMALPCVTAADVAAKMLVAHANGHSSCLAWDDPVWVEARALTGLT